MSDIVEKLLDTLYFKPTTGLCEEAVAEIERLRAQVERLRAKVERTKANMHLRDEFLVNKELWSEFISTLPSTDNNRSEP